MHFIVTLLSLWLLASSAFAEEGTFYDVKFIDCYDGDTCTVLVPYLPYPFTFLKVIFKEADTPEMNAKCPQEEQLAIQARLATIRWMAEASRIDLLQVTPDKFFRVDAVVMVDGMNLSRMLLESHLAVPMVDKRTQDWCLPLEEIFPDATFKHYYDPRELS